MKTYNKGFIYFICLVSAMGGLLFGYDWVVIGGAKIFYEQFFDIVGDPGMQGLAMSIALAGCLIGALTAGMLADKLGRKPLLLLSALIFVLTAYGTGAFSNFHLFLLARFCGGIAIGIASGLSPMYIAEVAPTHIRGKLVSLNQLTIVIGILAAQIVNWLLLSDDTAWNVAMAWRWMFWAAAFPALAFLVLAAFIPESPRWLAMTGQRERALETLARIGGNDYARNELNTLQTDMQRKQTQGGLALLFSKPYRRVLTLGIIVAMFQQWCGTNVIFNYAQEIFQSAGYDVDNTFINIVVTGIANLVFTFVAIYTVDRLGRRALMLLGAGGLAGIYLILGICYYFEVSGIFMVVLVVAAIACYAMTLGPVTWVLLSEIFPNKVRGVAVATGTFALWVASFILTYTFPFLNKALGTAGTFWIYTAICAAGLVFFLFRMPETKGKSLEQLEKEMVNE
ncbi:MAG TPA: sugar porter family MFS transporter [Mediterranea massiliensis]|uniref:Sugar porter family MFS transporter n=1 Tax=Mediterranea massiliensis TaxID=1841865 RepID=A0A921LCR5_9BACT|nr:sugar porter family MFS transporter [Mediterranea massiliensis]HJF92378.1 sugar porter family MFS transporter [Mediterranea massiliensis]